MNTILYDLHWENLLPLTYTRPVAEIRMGLFTLRQKWENYLKTEVSFKTQDYLSEKFPIKTAEQNLLINANIIANEELATAVSALKLNEALFAGEELLAVVLDADDALAFSMIDWEKISNTDFDGSYKKLEHPEQIFLWNGEEIRNDYDFWTKGRVSAPINETNRVLNPPLALKKERVQSQE